ncbi:sensor histidine kinase [Aureivirga marina]|uniref:sensor histidine kinase n=1 Tax=Aureivirga marina TaxID=1182451 RepID=UPI001E4334CD|nr:ATP-binding protein [Aureivirga marina]
MIFSFVSYRSFVLKLIKEKKIQFKKEIEYQKEISKKYIEAQENERKRMAEILHDDVGNKLNILSLWIQNEETWKNEKSREVISAQIPDLINATRNISHTMFPVNLEEMGLIFTIEKMLSNINSSIQIQLILQHSYQKKEITFEVQIYRVIQEFLTNSIKHANANHLEIILRDSEKFFSFLLKDNGKGFDLKTTKKGMGLKNIESRLLSIDSKFKWKSTKNKGCRLIVLIVKKDD